MNATPVGMYPFAGRSPLEGDELNCRLVFDTIYRPRVTKLLQLAARRGIETVSGVEMFVAQGTAQWEIWTGERAPVEAMRRAVASPGARRRKAAQAARGEQLTGALQSTRCEKADDDSTGLQNVLPPGAPGKPRAGVRDIHGRLLTPVGAYLRLARDAKYSFLLESVEGGETIARYTFAGANPVEVFRSRGRVCTLETGGRRVQFEEDPVEQLRRLTARYHPVRVPGLPPLIAGAIGYFAYDMVRLVERIPASGRDDLGLDDCVMMFYLGLVASITCGIASG